MLLGRVHVSQSPGGVPIAWLIAGGSLARLKNIYIYIAF